MVLGAVTAAAITLSMPLATLAAPAFNAPVSAENALAVAAECDPDGYYILQDGLKNGDDISFWLFGADNNAEGLDTAVHEQTHSYTWHHGVFNRQGYSEAIYLGNGADLTVPQTATFKTEEWAGQLPAELQTFRYSTYVAPGANPSANQDGVYGLLNEFSAYSWGMHTELNLTDYYKTGPQNIDTWQGWINSCENNFTAFCEFRFWMLGYLDYAYNNHRDVWNGIMGNQNFINAYCLTERRFENQIALYKARRPESGMHIKGEVVTQSASGYGRGFMLMSSTQRKLLTQIAQPQYQIQEQQLFNLCNVEVMPAADVNP